MDTNTKLFFITLILIGGCLSITALFTVSLSNSIQSTEQELQILQKATLFLLDDLYEDYLGELQHLSIDPGFYHGGEKRFEYLSQQLQQIEDFVNILDPERKAFEK